MSPLKPHQSKIIVLLTQQELLVAEIYRFFAGLFPETREFWDALSREEMDHATWMEYLYNKAREGTVHFDEARMRTYTVETFIKYLNDSLARIKDKAPTPQGAFSLALDIENSMLIRRLFDHFRSSDRELANLLLDLRSRMKEHRGRIEAQAAALPSGQRKHAPRR